MRYFPYCESSLSSMLETVGKQTLAELYSSIPERDLLLGSLNLPAPLDELRIKRKLADLQTPSRLLSFLGAGATEHFAPEWVSQQLLRSEWYTSYTPYQPEASQGTLQAIFEFQSIVSSLLGLGVANASMYDGATALVEALLMAARVTQKNTVLVSSAIHPEYLQTVKTYLTPAKIKILVVDFDNQGLTNIDLAKSFIYDKFNDVAAIAIQTPNFFGNLEDLGNFAELAHTHDALLVGTSSECLAFGAISSIGSQGADIAVAEGLGFLGGLNLGGPGLGLLACHKNLLRQMPGRLVGQSVDKFNNTGFALTLCTREQHIRRERATSNICTNHNLMALAFTMCLCAYGESGFKLLAQKNLCKTLYFRNLLQKHKINLAFAGPHFNETVLCFNNPSELEHKWTKALKHGFVPGLKLGKYFPKLSHCLLVSTTELHDDENIEALVKTLSEN